MAEKQYTAKQAALAVLEKVGEVLKKSELLKRDGTSPATNTDVGSKSIKTSVSIGMSNMGGMGKSEQMPYKKPEQDADQHADGKAPKGEIHPKEKEQAPSDDVRNQQDPQHNEKEQAEGNNNLAGTTPNQVANDGKTVPGFDEMKGHLKLAKFIGHMEHKRLSKKAL